MGNNKLSDGPSHPHHEIKLSAVVVVVTIRAAELLSYRPQLLGTYGTQRKRMIIFAILSYFWRETIYTLINPLKPYTGTVLIRNMICGADKHSTSTCGDALEVTLFSNSDLYRKNLKFIVTRHSLIRSRKMYITLDNVKWFNPNNVGSRLVGQHTIQ